jgi:hypothetical protein
MVEKTLIPAAVLSANPHIKASSRCTAYRAVVTLVSGVASDQVQSAFNVAFQDLR